MSHENPHTTQAVNDTKGCSPKTETKVPLLNTTPTQLIEHGKLELVPTQSLHFYILAPLVLKDTQHAAKRELITTHLQTL